MSRIPGSGNGRLIDFHTLAILDLIAVTALKAGWLVSINFLPAERYWPSASNGWAASARCSGVSDLLVPSQVKLTRTAAMLSQRLLAGAASRMGVMGSSRT